MIRTEKPGGAPSAEREGSVDYAAPLDTLMAGLEANPGVREQLRQDGWIAEGLRSISTNLQMRIGSAQVPSKPLKLENAKWTAVMRIEQASREHWCYGLGILAVEAISKESADHVILRSQEPMVGGGYPLSFQRNGVMLTDNFARSAVLRAGAGAERDIIVFTQDMAELLKGGAVLPC